MTRVTTGWPSVIVPVLSSTTVSIRLGLLQRVDVADQDAALAPRPVPTMSAAGTARPSAHGQAMISTLQTALAIVRPVVRRCPSGEHGPRAYQPTPVTRAIASTLGTKMAAIWSASCCTGGLLDWACSTSWTIWASAVSLPTLVTRTMSRPSTLTVPPMTSSPAVASDRQRLAGDHRFIDVGFGLRSTTPSVGTRSPGRTRTRSPTFKISATGTCVGSDVSSSNRRATAGARLSSSRIADPALWRARASSQWPRLMSASRPAASMKYRDRGWSGDPAEQAGDEDARL